MNARGWEFLAAAVDAVCAVAAAAYLVTLGLTTGGTGAPDRTPLDRVFPFALAAVVLVVLGLMAARSLRRARALPANTPAPHPTSRRPVAPVLSAEGRQLVRLVDVLAGAGLFAPRVPDPADLQEAVADAGEPVTTGTVLAALWEAGYWRPGFRTEDHLAALAFHDSQTEQPADALCDQVDDLARLAGDDLEVRLDALELADSGPVVRTQLRLTLGGEQEVLDYPGAAKSLSTVLHVAVARALRRTGGARLAWLWTDQGVWLAVLRDGVTPADLGATGDGWAWVDEQQPMAAGELGVPLSARSGRG